MSWLSFSRAPLFSLPQLTHIICMSISYHGIILVCACVCVFLYLVLYVDVVCIVPGTRQQVPQLVKQNVNVYQPSLGELTPDGRMMIYTIQSMIRMISLVGNRNCYDVTTYGVCVFFVISTSRHPAQHAHTQQQQCSCRFFDREIQVMGS